MIEVTGTDVLHCVMLNGNTQVKDRHVLQSDARQELARKMQHAVIIVTLSKMAAVRFESRHQLARKSLHCPTLSLKRITVVIVACRTT